MRAPVLRWLCVVSFLASCSMTPQATPTAPVPKASTAPATRIPPTSLPAPAPTPVPTKTPTVRPPSATPLPPTPTMTMTVAPSPTAPTPVALTGPTVSFVTCQITLPEGFTEDSPESGYFPADDDRGFISLDASDTDGGSASFNTAVEVVFAQLQQIFADYQYVEVDRSPQSSRFSFTGRVSGGTGQGAAYFAQVGTTMCGITVFFFRDVPTQSDAVLDALVTSLRVVNRPSPTATATSIPVPPTPSPTLPARLRVTLVPVPSGPGVPSRGGCGSRGGPGGPRTKSGKCPAWPK